MLICFILMCLFIWADNMECALIFAVLFAGCALFKYKVMGGKTLEEYNQELAEKNPQASEPKKERKKPCCPKCGSQNITYDIITDHVATKGTSEVRKKNAVTRAANSTGRAAMTMATGGLWLLTPKKSKYHEIKKEKTKVRNRKVAICQDCGADWTPLF